MDLIPVGIISSCTWEVPKKKWETEHRDINKQLFYRKQSQVKASEC